MIQQIEWIFVSTEIPEEGERVLISNSLILSFGTICRPWRKDPLKYESEFLIITLEYDQKEHEVRKDEQDFWFWTRVAVKK